MTTAARARDTASGLSGPSRPPGSSGRGRRPVAAGMDEDRSMRTDAPVTPTPLGQRVPTWVWDVLVVGVSLVFAFTPYRDPSGGAAAFIVLQVPVAVAVVVAQAGALLVRRRAPLALFVAEGVLLGIGMLLSGAALPFVMPVALAAYGLAKRVTRRTAFLSIVIAVVVFIGFELAAGHASGFDPRLLPSPLILAFAGAAGDATRSRRAYIAALAERAERAEATRESEARRRVAEERLRIARDLHDAVAHQIAVINLQSGVAARAVAPGREPDLPVARESLGTVSRAARDVLGEIGELLSMLRAESAAEAAPGAAAEPPVAPQAGLERLDDLLGRFTEAGLATTVRREGDDRPLPASVDRVAYLVLREALTNAHKHGGEHRAHLLLEQDASRLAITVTNPVDAVDVAPRRERTGAEAGTGGPGSASTGGHGLLGLRERVAAVRGTVEAGEVGGVFRLHADLPFGRSPALGRPRSTAAALDAGPADAESAGGESADRGAPDGESSDSAATDRGERA
ncbi:histidine kinase [Agromyces sp. MMS24-JH15]|uniref:sensor histidine kinase n=1 Tax=Agromyces sp. MMS24-JH15 TaxID=3243765 RepID=UPI0037487BD0